MTVEIPAPKMSKDEFLQRIETVTAAYGFERNKDRFIRRPDGYLLAQEIDFHWGRRSGGDYFSGQPNLWLRLRTRGQAYTKAPASSVSELLSRFGTMLDVHRANIVSYYNNMSDGPEWIAEFDRVLGAVLTRLDLIMRNKPLLLLYLRNDPSFKLQSDLKSDLIARVAELPENSQGN